MTRYFLLALLAIPVLCWALPPVTRVNVVDAASLPKPIHHPPPGPSKEVRVAGLIRRLEQQVARIVVLERWQSEAVLVSLQDRSEELKTAAATLSEDVASVAALKASTQP